MRVGVDKARSHHESGGVHLMSAASVYLSDGDDSIANNRHIPAYPRAAGPVDDQPCAHHEIEIITTVHASRLSLDRTHIVIPAPTRTVPSQSRPSISSAFVRVTIWYSTASSCSLIRFRTAGVSGHVESWCG